ncbi:MAG: GTP pyrophosphokinase family protein [Bacillota bacterium]|nr:GTP pyrophosphokinase family protein [Bacillota bacterium]
MRIENFQNIGINESMIPSEMAVTIDEAKEVANIFRDLYMRYGAAIKEISTKLEVLDNEYRLKHDYNPIHNMQSRLKSIGSIIEKIARKGWPMEVESIYKITDFAGVRVICNYIDDIYNVENSLLRQDDIKLIRRTDYIEEPKESGYRSLHLVVEVPIFLSDRTYNMPVEIQIRTIAMDTWASLEHELKYKRKESIPESVADELKRCADTMADLDAKMQGIHRMYL